VVALVIVQTIYAGTPKSLMHPVGYFNPQALSTGSAFGLGVSRDKCMIAFGTLEWIDTQRKSIAGPINAQTADESINRVLCSYTEKDQDQPCPDKHHMNSTRAGLNGDTESLADRKGLGLCDSREPLFRLLSN
jgi:hypothetical protein